MASILYADKIPINDFISVRIPSVGEVFDDEDNYYGLAYTITATPYDMMVQLDDAGIDFTTIDDWELFLLSFGMIRQSDTSLLFGDLDFSNFVPAVNVQNGTIILRDTDTGAEIDKLLHIQICEAIRKIHGWERTNKRPGNEEAKDYLIKKARKALKRRMREKQRSNIEDLVVSLVNTEQFSYNYETVRNMSIYQFNRSVSQIVNKINYDNRMRGVYAGTVNAKELKPDDMLWLAHK